MTRIASHRGGAFEWPENSPTAFRRTAALPVDEVEFDIHPTADGEIVVIHDATLERTTDGSGPVADHTLKELRALRLKGTPGETLPTLAEVAALFAPTGLGLRMEVKYDRHHRPYPGLLGSALAVLDRAGMRGRTVVTSFLADLVAEATAAPGLAGAIWLVTPAVQDDIGLGGIAAVAEEIDVRAVALRQTRLDRLVVDELRARGLDVGAYGVNDTRAIRHVLDLEVAAFTTGIPSTALQLRAELAPAGR